MTGPDGALPITPTGQVHQVTADRHERARAKFDEALRVATLGGDHLWTALATFLVDPVAAAQGGGGFLDTENLGGVYLGCYVCEQPFDQRLLTRRCPGEPR